MVTSLKENIKSLIFTLAIVAVAWILFAPVQLGGNVSYVIINGESMEPEIYQGDLVVARQHTKYEIGQSVVYTHPMFGYVFHRIVDKEIDGFILKGDNNDWLDTYHPTKDEIEGTYWFVIPKAGSIIRFLRLPVNFVLFSFVMVFIIGILFRMQNHSKLKKKKGKMLMSDTQNPTGSRDNHMDIFFLSFILMLIGIILAVVSYTKPLEKEIADDIFYSNTSTFSYSGTDEAGIYDRTGINTGDPIYPSLTCNISMSYGYKFSSMTATAEDYKKIQGSINVYAVISDPDGWRRSFLLVPDYNFQGRVVRSELSVDICRILDVVEEKEELTQTDVRFYTLSIIPTVTVIGELESVPFDDEYQPIINFEINESVLKLADAETGLLLNEEVLLPRRMVVDNNLTILGQSLTINLARQIAWILICMAVVVVAYPAYILILLWRESEATRIQLQNEPVMIEIKTNNIKKRGQIVVEVASIQDLKKMAERYGAVILHQEKGTTHSYSIQDEGMLFLYTTEVLTKEEKISPLEQENVTKEEK